MKKILSFLLVATMLVAMFVMPSAAADDVNFEVDFDYIEKAPDIDGVVKKGEYSTLPLHSYPENKSQFVDTEHYKFAEGDCEFDFYAGWDKDYVYMAWVVTSESFGGIPEKDFSGDGVWNPNDVLDNGWMWQYSCVQFIFTPGAPKKGETSYQTGGTSGDYLEVGLALTAEGQQVRACWSKPTAAQDLDVNDWDAAIKRDDSAKTTTYEVRIPWGKSGLNSTGNGAQFGLTYAVAIQADYNVKPGMIEWQNGVLTSKDADSAAVITLIGNEDIGQSSIVVAPVEKEEGTVPAEAEGKTQLVIDGLNVGIVAEKAYLYTNASTVGSMNTKWSTNVLLAPVEGEDGLYEVKEVVVGAGEDIAFTTELTDDMLVYAAHSDGQGAGNARKELATALAVGTTLKIFGVDFDKNETEYANSMLYVVSEAEGETSGEVSGDVSAEASSEAESSEEASSEAESTATSSEAESSAAAESSEAEKNEGGLGTGAIIGIIVAVLAVIAVVVFFVLKKKKQ